MARLAIFTHKNAGALAQRGLLLFTSFLRGCALHKKYQAPPPDTRPFSEVIHKNVSYWL
jgi:hypothetical protein